MPSEKPTLSERLLEIAEWVQRQDKADVKEAARLIAALEAEPAELLARAERLEQHADSGAHDATEARREAATLRAHARALVELAEAQARLAEAEKRKVPTGFCGCILHFRGYILGTSNDGSKWRIWKQIPDPDEPEETINQHIGGWFDSADEAIRAAEEAGHADA